MAEGLRRTINFGLHLILLTPLLVWSGFLFPHLTTKVLGFQILVEIVTVGSVAVLFIEMGVPKKELIFSFVSRAPFLRLTLVFFLGYSLLSALAGVDRNRSLWGFIERQDGLMLWLHFFAWFCVLNWFFKPDRLLSYVKFSYWVSAAVAATAILEVVFSQWLGFVPEWIRSFSVGRISGVFNNPTFLGPYLLFHIFCGFWYLKSISSNGRESLAARPREKRRQKAPRYTVARVAVVVTQFVLAAVVIMGQTRGAILGLLAGILILAAYAIIRSSFSRRIRISVTILVLSVLVGLSSLWLMRGRGFAGKSNFMYRLTHFTGTGSEVARLLVWRSALRGYRDHPAFGWGHNNIYNALNQYYDPRHVQVQLDFKSSEGTWYDKSHNFALDLLVEKGAVGGVLYLLIAAALIVELRRIPARFTAICLACGFIAYGISNMVAFDSFGSLFGSFLFLACVQVLSAPRSPGVRPAEKNPNRRDTRKRGATIRRGTHQPIGAIAGIFAALCVGLYGNMQIGLANAQYLEAQRAFEQSPDLGIQRYKEAFAHFSPYAAKQKLNCAFLIVNSLITKKPLTDPGAGLEYALGLAREAASSHPQDAAVHMVLNDLYNGLALYVDKKYVNEAEEAGKKALALSPLRQEVMIYLGRTYLIRSEPQRAVELNRRMVELYPGFPLAHWLLGLSLMAEKQDDLARDEVRKALEMGYKFQSSAEGDAVRPLLGEDLFNRLVKAK